MAQSSKKARRSDWTAKAVLAALRKHASARDREGMARFGIQASRALGVRIPVLRKLARDIGRDHALALELWKTGVHEARILAGMVDDPAAVTETQMEAWAAEFDSWDLTDQVCGNLFDKTAFAYAKAEEWAGRREEFVKRAGFALVAWLAWHDKEAADSAFERFLPIIEREAADGRNFVKKAVSWALRHIGKHRPALLKRALVVAKRLGKSGEPAARWVGKDAFKDLSRKR